MEVPAIAAGVLTEIRVQRRRDAPVGAVVAVIAGEGGAAASAPDCRRQGSRHIPRRTAPPAPSLAVPQQRGATAAGPPRSVGRSEACRLRRPARSILQVRTPEIGPARSAARVTPLARRLAGENGIDLSRMTGSGPRGRIVARDVESRDRASGARPRRADGGRAWRRAGQGALPGRRVRGGAARRHARAPSRGGWSRPSRPSRTSI